MSATTHLLMNDLRQSQFQRLFMIMTKVIVIWY